MFLESTDTGESVGLQNSKTKSYQEAKFTLCYPAHQRYLPSQLLTHYQKTEDEPVSPSTHKDGFAE